jgi:hypothetical protein
MYLYEELLLLAANPRTKRFEISPGVRALRGSIAGAILRDLELAQRIRIYKHGIEMTNPRPINHPILDPVLSFLWQEGFRYNLEKIINWVARFIPEIEIHIALTLVEKGYIHWNPAQRYYVHVINMHIWQELDLKIQDWLEFGRPIDAHGEVLLGISRWCGVLRHHVHREQISSARKHLDYIIRHDVVAKKINEIIEAEDSAAAVGAIVAIM